MGKEEIKDTKVSAKAEDNSVKITVDKQIADSLWLLVEKINDSFEAGRVHRQDVASWIISHFLKNYTDTEVGLIRQSYYTDSVMLESTYRRMKETGEVPEFIKDALRKQFQGTPQSFKKKKTLTKEYINDVHDSHEEAA